ncbi:MAG: enoyl-CoA hydratase-related protein [Pseudomonadota bacterium]
MTGLPDLQDILLEQRQSALLVTLNRPQAKNALNAAIVEGLMALCDWLQNHLEIRAVVLRGAGGAFCGGGDIKEFGKMLMSPDPAPGEADPIVANNRVFGDLLLKLDALPQTLICVVEGPCFGGANGFLSVSDVTLAAPGAKFSLSETTLGVPPAQIGPFLVRRIGLFAARRLGLTGAHFSAEEARAVGLVDRLATGGPGGLEELLAETLSAVGRCEPQANAATKKIFARAGSAIDPAQLDQAAEDFARCLRGKGREGAMAFAQKQAPPWVETFSPKKEV